jgi:hypothetical protein
MNKPEADQAYSNEAEHYCCHERDKPFLFRHT